MKHLRVVAAVIAVTVVAPSPASPPFLPARGESGPTGVSPSAATAMTTFMGAWEGEDADGALALRIVEMPSIDLPPSLYVELARDAMPMEPVWQQVWTFYESGEADDGGLSVRIWTFDQAAAYEQLYIAAWAHPDYFPKLGRARLEPIGDLPFTAEDGRRVLASASPMPIDRAGAWSMDFKASVEGDVLTWSAVGYDERGEVIWGRQPLRLRRAPMPEVATVSETGLLSIDLRGGEGPRAALRDAVAIRYNSYSLGGQQFFSTDWVERKLQQVTLPADYVAGFNEGIIGMQANALRRVVVPPYLGFGDKQHGSIPPNSWLIFDFEMLSVKDNSPEEVVEDPFADRAEPAPRKN